MALGVVRPGADSDLNPKLEALRREVIYDGLYHEGIVRVIEGRMSLSGSMAAGGGEQAAKLLVSSFEDLVDGVLPFISEALSDEEEGGGGPGTWNRDFASEHRKMAEDMEKNKPQTPEEFLKQ